MQEFPLKIPRISLAYSSPPGALSGPTMPTISAAAAAMQAALDDMMDTHGSTTSGAANRKANDKKKKTRKKISGAQKKQRQKAKKAATNAEFEEQEVECVTPSDEPEVECATPSDEPPPPSILRSGRGSTGRGSSADVRRSVRFKEPTRVEVQIESHKANKDLWFFSPGSMIVCDKCSTSVYGKCGKLTGPVGRSQFTQDVWICNSCSR